MGAMRASREQFEREHGRTVSFGGGDDDPYWGLITEMETKYGCRDVAYWNDTYGRTEDDVLTLLADMIAERELR